jgi:hypothetical protein
MAELVTTCIIDVAMDRGSVEGASRTGFVPYPTNMQKKVVPNSETKWFEYIVATEKVQS